MKYDAEITALRLSVKELCALAIRDGGLDRGRGSTQKIDAMTEGGRIHRKLQAEAGGFYDSEVPLSNTTLYGGEYYYVTGRADGIIREKGSVTVDEIKCVKGYAFFGHVDRLHEAQMKCYAYFLAVRDSLDCLNGRITYYNTDDGRIRYFNYKLTLDELRIFYTGLLERIKRDAEFVLDRERVRIPSAASAPFPYKSLREGQEIMVKECYSAVKHSSRLFVTAPTGTGKTMSALYGAVRALGKGECDKIFYLTPKTSTRREAFRAAAKLYESSAKLRAMILSPKERMCASPERFLEGEGHRCDRSCCSMAQGYYERSADAVFELLSRHNGFTPSVICNMAKKYSVCPYELSLDLSEYCDIVICDYNYAFDPSVYLRRFFAPDGKNERYVFLVDEAHDLADRARDMYSSELKLSELLKLSESLLTDDNGVTSIVESAITALLSLRELVADVTVSEEGESGFYMSREPLWHFCEQIELVKKRCETWLAENRSHPSYDILDAFTGTLRKFLTVNECFGKGFLCYIELAGGELTVKIYCLDPSDTMNRLLERAKATVFFSATLTPPEYFTRVLGDPRRAATVELPSPFDPARLSVTILESLSVRYGDRKKNAAKYATAIAATVSPKPGNYIAYFPSYECLEDVLDRFTQKYPKVEVVVQKRGMGYSEKEEFLSSFKDDKGRLRVGFCVLGGMFSEGVDLPGSRLIGSIIFGVGLPGLSNENNLIRDHYDNDNGDGYDFAYTYPGMNNVLQAAGRVIRRESDRGVVVLVDDRYATPKYLSLFPKHWKNIKSARNITSLAENIRRFWEKQG